MTEYVVLVDAEDRETGTMEKYQAHAEGKLHRAISVFIFNTTGELLLQKRAAGKYHSAGLWTNTCCSHPRPGEKPAEAAGRRLREEMGMVCSVKQIFTFTYKAEFDNELTEYELDHVYAGISDTVPEPDASEVAEWRYISKDTLDEEMARSPEAYTAWFRICYEKYYDAIFEQQL